MTVPAPLPADEVERLEALRGYRILDTPPEERFDRVVRLVNAELGVPISLISLVDAERQWFKARHGLDAVQTPRDLAFCAYAIHQDQTLVVEDAREDARFERNPLVLGDPGIRFYAGAPLVASTGVRLGTLCAIDRAPRVLTSREERLLRDLAAIVIDEMELSVAARALENRTVELHERNATLDTFVHALHHDLAGPIRRIATFCELLRSDSELSLEEGLAYMSRSAESAQHLLQDLKAFFLVDRPSVPHECSLHECIGGALELLAEEVEASGAEVKILGELPRLYLSRPLLTNLLTNLMSNSIKYRSDRPLEITISAEELDAGWRFVVEDNGMGIEESQLEKVFELLYRLHGKSEIPGSGMGLAITRKIVSRWHGEIWLESKGDQGTRAVFELPKESAASRIPAVAG